MKKASLVLGLVGGRISHSFRGHLYGGRHADGASDRRFCVGGGSQRHGGHRKRFRVGGRRYRYHVADWHSERRRSCFGYRRWHTGQKEEHYCRYPSDSRGYPQLLYRPWHHCVDIVHHRRGIGFHPAKISTGSIAKSIDGEKRYRPGSSGRFF